jgi:predicted nucleotidyltransferase
MILVGAGARMLIFDSKFGEGRRTTDLDVAVSMDSWEVYQQLRENLINGDSPRFQSTRIIHTFRHIETNIKVDIVPFGKIGEPDQQIVWPGSNNGNTMNVLGFTEALLKAKIESVDGLEIPVIDIPAFIVLKIFAWGDRKERTKKDLEDIEFILSKFQDDNRVYDELADKLASGSIDYLDANIYLLGQDIYKMLNQKTLSVLNSLLDELIERLGIDDSNSLERKLHILKRGINSLSLDT